MKSLHAIKTIASSGKFQDSLNSKNMRASYNNNSGDE